MPYTWGSDGTITSTGRRYETALAPNELPLYEAWKKQYAPNDSGDDYDYPGAYKAGLTPDPETSHWPDTYKKPNHPTFSTESIYAKGEDAAKAGSWKGETYIPPTTTPPPVGAAFSWNPDGSITPRAGGSTPAPAADAGKTQRRLAFQGKLAKTKQPYQLGPGGEIQATPGAGAGGGERAADAITGAAGTAFDVGGKAVGAGFGLLTDIPRYFTGAKIDVPPEFEGAAKYGPDPEAGDPYSRPPKQQPSSTKGRQDWRKDFEETGEYGPEARGSLRLGEAPRPPQYPDDGKPSLPVQGLEAGLGAMSAPFPIIGQTLTGGFGEILQHPEDTWSTPWDFVKGTAKGFGRGVSQAGERVAPAIGLMHQADRALSDIIPGEGEEERNRREHGGYENPGLALWLQDRGVDPSFMKSEPDAPLTAEQIHSAYGNPTTGGTVIAKELGWPEAAAHGVDLGSELVGGAFLEHGRPSKMRTAYDVHTAAKLGVSPEDLRPPDVTEPPPPPKPPPGSPPPGGYVDPETAQWVRDHGYSPSDFGWKEKPLPPNQIPLDPVGQYDYMRADPLPDFPPPLDVAPVDPGALETSGRQGRGGQTPMAEAYQRTPNIGTEGFEMRPGTSEPPPSGARLREERTRLALERQGEPWGHTMMPSPERGAPVRGGLQFDPGKYPDVEGSSRLPPVQRGEAGPGIAFEADAPITIPQNPPDLAPGLDMEGRRYTGPFPDEPHAGRVLVGEHATRDGGTKPIYQERLDVQRDGMEERTLADGVRATLSELPRTGEAAAGTLTSATDRPAAAARVRAALGEGPIYELTGAFPKEGADVAEPGKAMPVLDAARELVRGKGGHLVSDLTSMSPSAVLMLEREVARGTMTWDPEAGVYRTLNPGETARSGFDPSVPPEKAPLPRNVHNRSESADAWTKAGLNAEQAQAKLREIVEARHPEWNRTPAGTPEGGASDAGSAAGGVRPAGSPPLEGTGGGVPPAGSDPTGRGRAPLGASDVEAGQPGGGPPQAGGATPAAVGLQDPPPGIAGPFEPPPGWEPPGYKPLTERYATRKARAQGMLPVPRWTDEVIQRGGMRMDPNSDLHADWWELSRKGGHATKLFNANKHGITPDAMATDLGFADESALLDALDKEQRGMEPTRRAAVEVIQADHLEQARRRAVGMPQSDITADILNERGAVGRRVYTPAEAAILRARAMAAREELVKRYKDVDLAAKGILRATPGLGVAQAKRLAQEAFNAHPPDVPAGTDLPTPPNVPTPSTGPIPDTGDPAAPRVGGMLLDKFAMHGDLQRAMYDLAEANDQYRGPRRMSRSWADTEAGAVEDARQQAAKILGLEPDQLTQGVPVDKLAERLLLIRELAVSARDEFDSARQAFETDKSPEAYARFAVATSKFAGLSEAASKTSSETGRALNIMRRVAGDLARGKELQDVIRQAGGEGKLDTIALLYKSLPEESRPGFLRRAVPATTGDKLYEFWINGILSNPATWMANAASNQVFNLVDLGLHGALALTPGTDVSAQEFVARAAAYKRGASAAFGAFKLAFENESENVGGKFESPHPVAIGGKFGRGVRLPSRILGGTDAAYKALAYQMDVEGLAVRDGLARGLQGPALDAYREQVRTDSLTDKPSLLMKDGNRFADVARDRAEYLTFTQPSELANSFAQFGRRREGKPLSNAGRAAFNVVMPFKRTPINIAKAAIDHSPIGLARELMRGVGLLDPKTGLEATGAAKQMALARGALGSVVMGATMYQVLQGNITGYGPTNSDQRAALYEGGWLPYAFKIGDSYYSYSRLEPIATVLGLGADWGETIRDYPNTPRDNYAAAAGRMSLALAAQLSTKSYLQGPGEILQAVLEKDENKLDRVTQLLAGSVVPMSGFMRGMANVYDPTLRQQNSIWDAMQNEIPGFRQRLKPKREALTGDPVVRHFLGDQVPGIAMLSPIQRSYIKNDPFAKEVARLGIGLGKPPQTIELANGQSRDLTVDEYDRLLYIRGRMSHEAGVLAVQSPQYQSLGDGPEADRKRKAIINGIRTKAADAARQVLISEWGEKPRGDRGLDQTQLQRAYAAEQSGSPR